MDESAVFQQLSLATRPTFGLPTILELKDFSRFRGKRRSDNFACFATSD